MQPTFRQDLVCTRDEQDGVVYYQVEDPGADASFRLYEIEYHIARALDGKRSLLDVAEHIKREHDFEISDGDLLKFVGQLKQMRFVEWDDGDTTPDPIGFGDTPPELLGDVHTMELSLADVGLPLGASVPAAPGPGPDLAGAQQMLVSGLTHIRQGELAHARDFLLAAQQKNPRMPHLDRLVELVDGLGGGATAMELASLWQQCEVWFPDVVGTLGPVRQPRRMTGVQPRAPLSTPNRKTATAIFDTFVGGVTGASGGRPWVAVIGVVGVFAILGGGFYLMWNSATGVRGRTLEAERVPVFAPNSAIDKVAARDVWLSFDRPGKVGEIAAVGKRVGERETLIALALAPSQKQALDAAHAQVLAAENNLAQARTALEHIEEQRRPLEASIAASARRIQQLHPGDRGLDPVTRREMAKERAKAGRNKAALARVDKLRRGPQSAIARQQAQLNSLRHKQSGLEARFAVQRRVAPFVGEVTEVRAKAGDAIRAGMPLVHLQDPSQLHLRFIVASTTKLKPGGEAAVVADAGSPLTVKVLTIAAGAKAEQRIVTVSLHDPAGGLIHLEAKAFHLIERFVEPAFRVSSRALLRGANADLAQVLVSRHGHAVHYPVQVLSDIDGEAIIFDPNNQLPDRGVLITGQEDGSALTGLAEGTEVDVVPP